MSKRSRKGLAFHQNAMQPILSGLAIMGTFFVMSCTSNLEKVGQTHRTAAQKWKAMAEYAANDLPLYGYTITAEIKLIEDENIPNFELDNFKFDFAEQSSTIDLLRPEFSFKFVCKKICIQLTEYIKTKKSSDTEATDKLEEGSFLAKQLKRYEFELFEFYAKLFLLNENIKALAKLEPEKFNDYLYYLVKQNIQKSEIKDFVNYATNVLSQNAFQAFLSDPTALQGSHYNRTLLNAKLNGSTFVSKYAVNPSLTWLSKEQVVNDGIVTIENSAITKVEKPPIEELSSQIKELPTEVDSILLLTLKTQDEKFIESLNFSEPSPESNNWQKLTRNNPTTSYWDKVREMPISGGSFVCSYQDNYFGVVKSLNESSVLILVNGKAKQYRDGVLKDAEPGILFRRGSEVQFLPISDEIQFDRHNLAPCKIL